LIAHAQFGSDTALAGALIKPAAGVSGQALAADLGVLRALGFPARIIHQASRIRPATAIRIADDIDNGQGHAPTGVSSDAT
jgi:hypothetical protein